MPLLNYIYDLWNTPKNSNLCENNYYLDENTENDYYLIDKKYLITKELLNQINLTPVKNDIKTPNIKARPINKVNLRCLNKEQLNIILNVKLKPIPKIQKTYKYDTRHPVLKEMLEKTKIKY